MSAESKEVKSNYKTIEGIDEREMVPFQVACALCGIEWSYRTVGPNKRAITKAIMFKLGQALGLKVRSTMNVDQLNKVLKECRVSFATFQPIADSDTFREAFKKLRDWRWDTNETILLYKKATEQEKQVAAFMQRLRRFTPSQLGTLFSKFQFECAFMTDAGHWESPDDDGPMYITGIEKDHVRFELSFSSPSTSSHRMVVRDIQVQAKCVMIRLQREYRVRDVNIKTLELVPFIDDADKCAWHTKPASVECLSATDSDAATVCSTMLIKYGWDHTTHTYLRWRNQDVPRVMSNSSSSSSSSSLASAASMASSASISLSSLKRPDPPKADIDDENIPVSELIKRGRVKQ